VPKQNSIAGKPRQGSISKAGERYLWCLLARSGLPSVIGHARIKAQEGWLATSSGVAQTNKTARIA
jgi:hypothetical protein